MPKFWSRTGLALAAALAIPGAALAANAAPNTVVSSSIRPADGTTGQTLTSGSGVKTGHLQDGAVTAPKIAPGAVGAAALGTGAVTGAKLAPGAVGAAAIAPGAVTADKITGPLPASLVSSVGLDADTLDGQHASAFATAFHGHPGYLVKSPQLIIVAPDGTGDFTDPSLAVQSIVDASASKPYLVKLMPGRYAVALPVITGNFIDVEGSGQGVTRVVNLTGFDAARPMAGGELRDLTLEAPGSPCVARTVNAPGPIKMTRVTIVGSAAPNGQVAGICAYSYTPLLLDRVTIDVVGNGSGTTYGIWSNTTDLRLRDSAVTASGGASAYGVFMTPYPLDRSMPLAFSAWDAQVEARGAASWTMGLYIAPQARSTVTIRNSLFSGIGGVMAVGASVSGSDLAAAGSEFTGAVGAISLLGGSAAKVANSKLAGPPLKGGTESYRCFGTYDDGLLPVACP